MTAQDSAVVEALRRGDEPAFAALIDCYHSSMVRVARLYVSDRAAAEDAAQEAWLGVVKGIDRFEGRSSLRTWIFRILTNRAKTRAERERRSLPFSALAAEMESDEPAVDPERFLPADAPAGPGRWTSAALPWDGVGEERFLAKETMRHVEACIETLPPLQRQVLVLRDVDGWSGAEVCGLLELSDANQRVLLHRARAKVRRAMEAYLADDAESACVSRLGTPLEVGA